MNALILVDIQNDFLPGGALAVPHGDEVVSVANSLLDQFPLVIATQDWHPANHASFASNHPGHKPFDHIQLNGLPQTLWPDHCIQGSRGADFAPALRRSGIHEVVQKGTDPAVDSYSGFFDNARLRSTNLASILHSRKVDHIFVMGLATDYCVKATALDARSLGFATTLITKGCRGVDLNPGDSPHALRQMQDAGVTIS